MQKLIGVNLIAASVLITGCHDDHNHSNNDQSAYIGTWTSPAYGYAMVVTKDQVDHYEYSSDYCIKSETENLPSGTSLANDDWLLADDKQSMRQIIDYLDTDIRYSVFYKSNALPTTCIDNLIAIKGDDYYEENQARDFELFWQTFNEYYMSFAIRDVDWEAQRSELTTLPHNINSDEQLFQAMSDMIEPLKDPHVIIESEDKEDAVYFYSGVTLMDRINDEFTNLYGEVTNEEQAAALDNYTAEQLELVDEIIASYAMDEEAIQQVANDELTWFITPENIGYLKIKDMGFFSGGDPDVWDPIKELNALEPAMNQVIAGLTNTDGMIIDIRHNFGGDDIISQLIARYFLDNERYLYSKQARLGDERTEPDDYSLKPVASPYLKPVVVLTSKMSNSAAEVFALMMRAIPHVTLVGEPSQGALSDTLIKQLPNGMRLHLVNEYYLTPQGEWFEGTGVPVEYEAIYSTLEQRQNHTDEGMNQALQLLTSPAAN